MRAIGYVRTSTADQENGLESQRLAVIDAIERKGWDLIEVVVESASGRTLARRNKLNAALRQLDNGEADVLVVAKLDRLSRSLRDFLNLVDRAERKDWSITVLDHGLDTSTPVGRMTAHVLMSFAQFEREIISVRTREGLAVVRANGTRLGRERTMSPTTESYIRTLSAEGLGRSAIADRLNTENVPTATDKGKQWYSSTVLRVLQREAL